MCGVATLQLLWSPCARHEEEVVEREVEAWSKRPQSEVLEVPRWLLLPLPLVSYIQVMKLRIH